MIATTTARLSTRLVALDVGETLSPLYRKLADGCSRPGRLETKTEAQHGYDHAKLTSRKDANT
jgi:hypothetical protein